MFIENSLLFGPQEGIASGMSSGSTSDVFRTDIGLVRHGFTGDEHVYLYEGFEDPKIWAYVSDDTRSGTIEPGGTVTLQINIDLTVDHLGYQVDMQDGDFAAAVLNLAGVPWEGGEVDLVLDLVEGVDGEASAMPLKYALHQNYPNPFNPSTTVNFDLVDAQQVRLGVYNLLGREVTTLVNEKMEAGYHSVSFNGSDLASGVYFYRLETDAFTSMKKMVLVK